MEKENGPFPWIGNSAHVEPISSGQPTGWPQPSNGGQPQAAVCDAQANTAGPSLGSFCIVEISFTAFPDTWLRGEGSDIVAVVSKDDDGEDAYGEYNCAYDMLKEANRNSSSDIPTSAAYEIDREINRHLNDVLHHLEGRGLFRCDGIAELVGSTRPEEGCTPRLAMIGICTELGMDAFDWCCDAEELTRQSQTEGGQDITVELQISTLHPHFFPQLRSLSTLNIYEFLNSADSQARTIHWGKLSGQDKFPLPDESFACWVERVGVSKVEIAQQARKLEILGGDIALYERATRKRDGEVEFLVPGLIPRGMVTLLLGASEVGKSTLLSELCYKVDFEVPGTPSEFLGNPVPTGLVSFYLSGEDGDSSMDTRARMYEQIGGISRGAHITLDCRGRSWKEDLDVLKAAKQLDLVIFDPARRFLEGNEDSSDAIDAFFEQLVELAKDKNCAVVLVHHLGKLANPKSLNDISPRGSGVFIDRPRIILGMFRSRDGSTGVGIIKNSLPGSIEMWARKAPRFFRFDQETQFLEPLSAHSSIGTSESQGSDAGLRQAVLAAIGRLSAQKQVVQPTGKRELFQLGVPEIQGAARGKIRETVTALIAEGKLEHGPHGIVVKIDITQ